MCRVEGMLIVLGFLLDLKRFSYCWRCQWPNAYGCETFEGPHKLGLLYVGLGGVFIANIMNDDEQVVIVVHDYGKKNVNMTRNNIIIVWLLLAHQITSLPLLPW